METRTLVLSPFHVRGNRLDLLSRIAEDLAHEVKNPLHAIAINLELTRRRASAGAAEAVLERTDIVEAEVRRVHELVDALLHVLRPPHEEPTVILREALRELHPLIHVQTHTARIELAWEVSVDPPRHRTGSRAEVIAAIPRDALDQIVLNLVANAIEAMRPGPGRLELAAAADDDEITLRIRDSGPGWTAAAAANFGVPGYSTRPGHAGFGIAVAKTLLEAAGGRLELEDAGSGGTGAAVRITVPNASSA